MSTSSSGMLATAYYSPSQHVIVHNVVQDVQTAQASSDYIMKANRRRMWRIQCRITATDTLVGEMTSSQVCRPTRPNEPDVIQDAVYYLALVCLQSNMILWNSKSVLILIDFLHSIWLFLFPQYVFSQVNDHRSLWREMGGIYTVYFCRGISEFFFLWTCPLFSQ